MTTDFEDDDQGRNDEGEGDEGELQEGGDSDLRYPMWDKYKVRDGVIARVTIERLPAAGGAPTVITEYADPVSLDRDVIRTHCGGGKFILRPRKANNQFLGSVSTEIAGPLRPASELVWPDSLQVNYAPSRRAIDAPKGSSAPDPQRVEDAALLRDRAANEWQFRMAGMVEDREAKRQREEREWQEERDERRREHEAKLAREQAAYAATLERDRQAHEMRMLELKMSLEKSKAGDDKRTEVELKKVEMEGQLAMIKTKAEIGQKGAVDLTDRLMGFGEKVVAGVVEKNPGIVAEIADRIMGSKLEASAQKAVKERVSAVAGEIGVELVDTVMDQVQRKLTPEMIVDMIRRDPAVAAQIAEALREPSKVG